MDAVSLSYYGLVCGVLAGLVPRHWRMPARFGLGVLVGLVAASALPALRGML